MARRSGLKGAGKATVARLTEMARCLLGSTQLQGDVATTLRLELDHVNGKLLSVLFCQGITERAARPLQQFHHWVLHVEESTPLQSVQQMEQSTLHKSPLTMSLQRL
mmetsp:Transcript_13601/g.33934  ORF Transcript_13601/g.33934 Transcript_13601/m.33934 type:complete len:107 (-) Transcript_13601:265-585(-)